MNLYLIKTKTKTYATNGETKRVAIMKFSNEYPEIGGSVEIQKITPEELVEIKDNDSIIFF